MRILFNSEKGGTGKTTLSTLLAAYLAMRGRRVLIIDLDNIQAHATKTFGLEPGPGLYDCIVRGVPLAERVKAPPADVWVPEGGQAAGSVHVLPTNTEALGIPYQSDDWLALAKVLETPSQPPRSTGKGQAAAYDYDVVIVDSPPSGGMMLTLAWHAVDCVIIPTELERLSIDGLIGTLERAEQSGTRLLGIVPNRVKMQTVLHRHYYALLTEAAEASGWPVLDPIADAIAWADSSHIGQMIYGAGVEMGRARREAIRFCRAVEGMMEVRE